FRRVLFRSLCGSYEQPGAGRAAGGIPARSAGHDRTRRSRGARGRGRGPAAAHRDLRSLAKCRVRAPMTDSLLLELADFEHLVHTGIYSEETGQPQPLRFSVTIRMRPIPFYDPDTPLAASKNYMDLKFACAEALGDTHYQLIEAVADHV